jgi:hypothetical protein
MPGNSDERGTIETPNPAQTAARTLTLLDPVKPILQRVLPQHTWLAQQREQQYQIAGVLESGAASPFPGAARCACCLFADLSRVFTLFDDYCQPR